MREIERRLRRTFDVCARVKLEREHETVLDPKASADLASM